MKQRKETCVTNVFSVDYIVTVYHFPLESRIFQGSEYTGNGVVYDFWQLYYVERGECAFEIDGCDVVLCAGQLALFEPGKVRRTKYMKQPVVGIVSFRCRSAYLETIKNIVIDLTEDTKKTLHKLLKIGTEIFTGVSDSEQYIGQELRGGASEHQLQMVKNLLELVMIDIWNDQNRGMDYSGGFSNQQNYYQKQFLQIEAYLKANLHRNISVSDVCTNTGLSVGTVKRICRIFVGCGVIHHFLGMKIEKTKQMIRDTDLNYMQISEMFGFSSVHYFSRLFKTFTGLSPSQYAQSFSDVQS